MIKCSESCIPCCDFCIYAVHEELEDEESGGTFYDSPVWCEAWQDEEHAALCESCSFCEDFHCFRATKENYVLVSEVPQIDLRAKRRHTDFKKAIRKRNITKSWHLPEEYYSNLHQFSKNKIHCSCPMCSQKTNNKHRPLWETPMNWPMKDKKRLDEMKEQVEEEWLDDSQD